MTTIFDKNMACLKENFPYAYNEVMEFRKSNMPRNISLNLVETKNGLLNIRVQSEESSIFLHSNYNPENEASTLLNSQMQVQADASVILGFGMGYHIEKLIQEKYEKTKIVIEPNVDIFSFVLEHRDVTHIIEAKNFAIVVTDSTIQVSQELIYLFQLGRISSLDFVALPSYVRLHNKFWDDVYKEYAKFMRTFTVNVRTITVFKNTWLANFFHNLKHVTQSADINDFLGKFTSVPAILVSSGPSLSKNIDLLKDLNDKAIIIAAGSAISVLQSKNIKPHVMLGIDGGEDMADIYNRLDWDDILFAYVLNLHYKSLDHYKGPKVYIKSTSEPQVDWFERSVKHVTPSILAGGSCANLCLDFVKKIGCNPVIFIGQDLAYTDMQTHADGCIGGKKLTETNINSKQVKIAKDIYGEEIQTNELFMTMGYTFEGYIASLSKEHIFINSTEGGLPIKGTEVMNLKDALEKYCKVDRDIKTKINEIFEESKNNNIKLEKKTIKFVSTVIKQAKKITEVSKKRQQLITKIKKNIDRNKLDVIPAQRTKLFDLTAKLEENVLFKEVIGPSCYDISLVFKNTTESEAKQKNKVKEKMEILYSGLEKQYKEIEEKSLVINWAANEAIKRLDIKEEK